MHDVKIVAQATSRREMRREGCCSSDTDFVYRAVCVAELAQCTEEIDNAHHVYPTVPVEGWGHVRYRTACLARVLQVEDAVAYHWSPLHGRESETPQALLPYFRDECDNKPFTVDQTEDGAKYVHESLSALALALSVAMPIELFSLLVEHASACVLGSSESHPHRGVSSFT
jgi:hypothetical protein